MAYLTNFSFEFFYNIFTEDAFLPLLYHGAKKVKNDQKLKSRGFPALRVSRLVTADRQTKLTPWAPFVRRTFLSGRLDKFYQLRTSKFRFFFSTRLNIPSHCGMGLPQRTFAWQMVVVALERPYLVTHDWSVATGGVNRNSVTELRLWQSCSRRRRWMKSKVGCSMVLCR